jgi:hypothetical protein
MEYEELHLGCGSMPLCQPDEWWPEKSYVAAYGIGDSKRASRVTIRDSETMGRVTISPIVEDFVATGPNAEAKLDKKILKRRDALYRKGCTRVIKFVRQRFTHGEELVEQYSMLGFE